MKNYLPWKDEYRTGIKSVDSQHQQLFQIINDLIGAIHDTNSSKEVLNKAIQKMTEYAEFHFKHEEEIFRAYQYPSADDHHQKHELFKKTVQDLFEKNQTQEMMKTAVLAILKDWWLKHILVEDMTYAPFIKSKGEKIGLTEFDQ